jgi:H+/Cl- antiporter ClcA
MPDTPNPLDLLKTNSYLVLLALAALIGLPVAVVAYFFLELVSWLQHELFQRLPTAIGFTGTPPWWPLPLLAVSGLVVGLCIRYLPGRAGHSPADGFKVGGGPPPIINVPGVALAALATLALGVVLGPEGPLIAIGGGLGALAVHLAKRDAPPTAIMVIAGAGSFAAISTLLGSPIVGAFLLMEATGLGGPLLGVVLVPGLLASGIGFLVFVGLDNLTGFGTFSLTIPHLSHFGSPTFGELGWAVVIGLAATLIGKSIRWGGLFLRPFVQRNLVAFTVIAGLAVAGIAIGFAEGTGQSYAAVLFSGQAELAPLVSHSASWSIGALVAVVLCKGLAYSISLSSFRGGPTFPALFIGGAGGIAMSHLPGLPMVAGIAMGIGAMATVMLNLPLTAVLLASIFVASSGVGTIPLIIVAVVVDYVASAHFAPVPANASQATELIEEAAATTPTGPLNGSTPT